MDAVGRTIGFVMMAGPAMAILAGVVLLRPYASMLQAEHDEACAKATTADAEAQVRANERLITTLPTDQVLTKRLAESQMPVTPQHEIIIPSIAPFAGLKRTVPDLVVVDPSPRPAPPPKWVMTAAGKMENPSTRRSLLLLALGGLITAVYLFTPPQWPSRRRQLP
jgi:hypothetical protein